VENEMGASNLPLVSVVVATRNNAATLDRMLSSIRDQTYPNVELIVVDNSSTDETASIAEGYGARVVTWGPERTAQVNHGVSVATGKYVYYTGGDTLVDADFIDEAVSASETNSYDAIYLNVVTRIEHPNFWQRGRAFERNCYHKVPRASAARFYRREVFLAIGGLDEGVSAIADDYDFQYRLDRNGYHTGLIDSGENMVSEYDGVGIIVKRALYYGWQYGQLRKKSPAEFRQVYRTVRPEIWSAIRQQRDDWTSVLAFFTYKSLQATFGVLGAGLEILSRGSPQIERFLYGLNYGRR
jgi:glycosyltransferase involved in cell wall biosynthesis